jgi:hypothetical protein
MVNRRFQFQKCSQLFIRVHNETLPVIAVCINNPDRSPLRINRRNPAPTPSGFVEIVSDDFPVLHRRLRLLIVQNRLRCGLAQFKLCAHFLDLSLQFSNGSLEILLLLSNRRL